MSALWTFVWAFLPGPVQALILGFLALIAIILVFKVIGMVLNAIPFL